ncbi:MAG: inorganic diphosphatase [Pseudonocardia sp.]
MADHDASSIRAERTASLELALSYLHQQVTLQFDRPAGSLHPVHGYRYPINYGYVPGTHAPDGDELDGYYLGTDQPLTHADGTTIAVIHRIDDDDDKLVVTADPTTAQFTDTDISAAVEFQEHPGRYLILRNPPD